MSARSPGAAIRLVLAYTVATVVATVATALTTDRALRLPSWTEVVLSTLASPVAVLAVLMFTVSRAKDRPVSSSVLALVGALAGSVFVLSQGLFEVRILMLSLPPLLTFHLGMLGAALDALEVPVGLDEYALALGTIAVVAVLLWYFSVVFKPTRNPYFWIILPLDLAIIGAWTATWLRGGRGRDDFGTKSK